MDEPTRLISRHVLSCHVMSCVVHEPVVVARVSRSSCSFHRDSSIPLIWSTHPSDYTNQGYDRGHLSPAADGGDNQV